MVHARHAVWYAVPCLVVALSLSFVASKGMSIRAERDKLRNRILELRPFWLQSEPSTMAVVWGQSIAGQANQLAQRTTLPNLETVHKRLDVAAELLLAIDRLRRVRVEIRQTALPPLALARAFSAAPLRLQPTQRPRRLRPYRRRCPRLRRPFLRRRFRRRRFRHKPVE